MLDLRTRHLHLCEDYLRTCVYSCLLRYYATWYRMMSVRTNTTNEMYEGVSKSFRTGSLERELQMVQLSATWCSCIAILWVRLVSFVAITLCVASQRVFVVVVYFVVTQSGNFWIKPRVYLTVVAELRASVPLTPKPDIAHEPELVLSTSDLHNLSL
jgi:hypothetical protein